MSSYAQPSGLRSSRKWLLNTLLATASVSAVAAIAPHANAQEAAGSSDAPMIEELVVTAEKREQSLQSVPSAVSAYTSEKRDVLGVGSVEDLARITPGEG